jgi:hypothetical protein
MYERRQGGSGGRGRGANGNLNLKFRNAAHRIKARKWVGELIMLLFRLKTSITLCKSLLCAVLTSKSHSAICRGIDKLTKATNRVRSNQSLHIFFLILY